MFGFTGSFTTSATVLLFQVISGGGTKQTPLRGSDFLDAAATVMRKQILKGYLNLHFHAIWNLHSILSCCIQLWEVIFFNLLWYLVCLQSHSEEYVNLSIV